MRIELRILSGARAGQSEVFDKATILVGRKPANDLRFDTHGDLDVSGDHAQIREHGGRWFVVDTGSTNGTYLNGLPIRDEAPIKDGDVIGFGKNGPTVEVRAKGDPTGKTPAIPRTDSRKSVKAPSGAAPMSTQERVAVAVHEETRGIKTVMWGSIVGLGAIAVAAYWIGTHEGGKKVADMQRTLAQAESTQAALNKQLLVGDTLVRRSLQRTLDSLRAKANAAAQVGNDRQIDSMKRELEQLRVRQQGVVAMDMPTINAENQGAVAFLVTELDGVLLGGTAFGITKSGLMVTNRHNVKSPTTGAATTSLQVKFGGSSQYLRARVVKVVDEPDLALIQVERSGEYPTVRGISAKGDIAVGAPVAMIGFPLSLTLPMEGSAATTTLSPGTASKRIPSLLQIDAFGSHGMSGSPVFDSRGLVVGVVFGGPKDAPHIIFAVPSDLLAQFLGDAAAGIVR
jgi:S1-C subfamily serine protease